MEMNIDFRGTLSEFIATADKLRTKEPGCPPSLESLAFAVRDGFNAGRRESGFPKIQLIKAVRDATNWGLKESKEWLEREFSL